MQGLAKQLDVHECAFSHCHLCIEHHMVMENRPLDQHLDVEASLEARRETIYGFFASKISGADIASKCGYTTAEVQEAIDQAQAARPRIELRENRVTWELHYAIVQKLDEDSGAIIKNALQQAGIMKARQRDTISIGWMDQWEALLRGDLETLKAAMLDIGHEAEDLRQMSPFIGALTEEERQIAILKASIILGK